MRKATTADVKKANLKSIFQFIYHQHKTTKLEIATRLHLSRPTVNQCVKELEERGLIEKNGYFESTGGRKADAISMISSTKIAVGVELLQSRCEIVAIDLYGDIIASERHPLEFEHNDGYYRTVCQRTNDFIARLRRPAGGILGVAIVLQGLISSDGNNVTYGKILGCTGLSIQQFTKHIPLPCRMFHDAESAATVELWHDEELKNAFFFHIRTNLSGALIVNGKFLPGNQLKSGVFEHMTIVPGGTSCYCGKKGCLDCYSSYPVLLGKHPSLDAFFHALRSGDPDARTAWEEYLYYLAIGIDNLHMLIDYDVILGGTLGVYLQPEDIDSLHRLVKERSAFPTNQRFIKISRYAATPIAKGAALSFIQNYLESVAEVPFDTP